MYSLVGISKDAIRMSLLLFPFQIALPFGDSNEVLATYNAEEEQESEEGTRIYAKKDAQLYGTSKHKKDRFVSLPFMKKYIHVARNIRVFIELTAF